MDQDFRFPRGKTTWLAENKSLMKQTHVTVCKNMKPDSGVNRLNTTKHPRKNH